MVTEVRLLQPLKAKLPMLVTLFGMVTEDRWVQPLKAASPIFITLFGIVTEYRLQSLNASPAIPKVPSASSILVRIDPLL